MMDDWSRTPRGRVELLLAGLFVLLNVGIPLLIVDLFPFSRAPMFEDAPVLYCNYLVRDPQGQLFTPAQLVDVGLQRNYWGNPLGSGVGFQPPPTVDRVGEVAPAEEVRARVETYLSLHPALAYLDVVQQVLGPIDSRQVGVMKEQSWRIVAPARSLPTAPARERVP